MVKKSVDTTKYDLAKFNSFSRSVPKVMHRAVGYEQIHMGNHRVDMEKVSYRVSKDIAIYHYNIRSAEQFKRKILIGGAGLVINKTLDKSAGAHWRYFFEGSERGELDMNKEYEKVIGKQYWDTFLKKGVLVEATFVKDFFHAK